MNCWFCDKSLEASRETHDSDDQENYPVFHRYFCAQCLTYYNVLDVIGQVTDYTIHWNVYSVEFDVANSQSQIVKGTKVHKIDSHTGMDRSFMMYETILRFDHLINITPQNIQDKVPLYILFS